MASTDDFSFPTTADLYPSGLESPPLWRLSPVASPDVFLHTRSTSTKEEEEEEDGDCFKQSNEGEDEDEDEEEDEEEKMDLLWEDFNEELMTKSNSGSSTSRCWGDGDDERQVELGCVEALKLSKTNAMFSPRKTAAGNGMLVFMKVLRKLFLLHTSHQRSVHVKHPTFKTP